MRPAPIGANERDCHADGATAPPMQQAAQALQAVATGEDE
jgi:hypothetical protein